MTPVGTAGALEPMGSGKLEVIIECKFYKLNFLGNCSECWAYLIRGTGKAWAWHSRAKAEPFDFSTSMSLYSREKVGALAPTGSVNEVTF